MKLRDQRDMHGAPTVEAQRELWVRVLARLGLAMRDDDRVLTAYVSDGRWVAQCPCNGGIAAWRDNPHGCGFDCGHANKIRFPKDNEIAEALLLQRPAKNRHWRAHEGETVRQLEAENRYFLRGEVA